MEPDMREPIPGAPEFGKLAPMLVTELPLFMGAPKATSVTQQLLTNCPLPALLAAIAHADPNRLTRMVQRMPLSKPRSVWFLIPELLEEPEQPEEREREQRRRRERKREEMMETKSVITVFFQRRAVEITPRLYVNDLRNPRFAFADDGSGWVSYIEKAYVVHRGNHMYKQLDFLGGVSNPLTVARVVEDVAVDFDMLDIDDRVLWRDWEPVSPLGPQPDGDTFETGNFVGLRGRDSKGRSRRTEMVKEYLKRATTHPTIATDFNHTKAVLLFNADEKDPATGKKGMVTLFDPLPNRVPRKPKISLDEFIRSHDAIYQVRK